MGESQAFTTLELYLMDHVLPCCVQVLFQFAYTSCFGAYAACLLLQSGTVLAPVGAHIACNVMGVPDFPHMAQHPKSRFLLVMTVVGVVCFWWTSGFFVDPHWFCQNSSEPCLKHAIQGLSRDTLQRRATWHS